MTNFADQHPLARELEQDSAVEQVPRRWVWPVFLAPWVGAVLVALTALHRELFTWIVAEDHVLEWAQFVLYAAAAVVAALCARPLWANGNRLVAVFVLLLALFCVFVAGEEISWGQRIFGFGTPVDLESVNHQDEFNLHNITRGGFNVQKLFNDIQIAAGLVGGVLPWLTRVTRPRLGARFWRLVSPALALTSAFLIIGLYRVARLVIWSSDQVSVVVKFGEWPELCLAFGLFGYTWLLWRSQRRERSGATPVRRLGSREPQSRHAR